MPDHRLILKLRISALDLILDLSHSSSCEQLLVVRSLYRPLIKATTIAVEVNDLLPHPAAACPAGFATIAGIPLRLPDMDTAAAKLDETHAVPAHPAFRCLTPHARRQSPGAAPAFYLPAIGIPSLWKVRKIFSQNSPSISA